MNCPGCGLQTLTDQKFCRSCGASLQMTTRPLVDHATVSDLKGVPAVIFRNEERRVSRMVLWGFIMMFIGVAFGATGKMIMHNEIVTVVGILVSLAGMFLTAYPYASPAAPKKYVSSASPREVPARSQPTRYLSDEGNTEYVPGITERTTDLLVSKAATRVRQKEDEESQV